MHIDRIINKFAYVKLIASFNIHLNITEFELRSKIEEFKFVRTIGVGSFGRVSLVQKKTSGDYFALKILEKTKIVTMKQIEHTLDEKQILNMVSFPFIVSFRSTFKDNCNLYILQEYVAGGELFSLLRSFKCISEDHSRFYASQIILAFEYLHSLSIIYRDLKPENILVAQDGYIKLADFGFAKRVENCTYTLCGTPEYLAPEIILSKGYTSAVDWWALGILIFEMAAGIPPFYGQNSLQTYEKIIGGQIHIPSSFSTQMSNLIVGLLNSESKFRYGNLTKNSIEVKAHVWFSNVNWIKIYNKQVRPNYLPSVHGPWDTTNFDEYEEVEIKKSDIELYYDEFIHF